MKDPIHIKVSTEVFERLQSLAKPFVDSPNSVIERLLLSIETVTRVGSPADASADSTNDPTNECPPQESYTYRGTKLPLGKLRAFYGMRGGSKHELRAAITRQGIEFQDKIYESPSSAGIEAKRSVGARENAASTNGWDFWEYFDESKSEWVSIDTFRSKDKITLEDLGL